jgi:hypothetical protein
LAFIFEILNVVFISGQQQRLGDFIRQQPQIGSFARVHVLQQLLEDGRLDVRYDDSLRCGFLHVALEHRREHGAAGGQDGDVSPDGLRSQIEKDVALRLMDESFV